MYSNFYSILFISYCIIYIFITSKNHVPHNKRFEYHYNYGEYDVLDYKSEAMSDALFYSEYERLYKKNVILKDRVDRLNKLNDTRNDISGFYIFAFFICGILVAESLILKILYIGGSIILFVADYFLGKYSTKKYEIKTEIIHEKTVDIEELKKEYRGAKLYKEFTKQILYNNNSILSDELTYLERITGTDNYNQHIGETFKIIGITTFLSYCFHCVY